MRLLIVLLNMYITDYVLVTHVVFSASHCWFDDRKELQPVQTGSSYSLGFILRNPVQTGVNPEEGQLKHLFNGPFSMTTWVSCHQKGKNHSGFQ